MDLEKTLDKINKDREKVEAAWVFCLWKNPELYEDYKNINSGKDKTLKNEDAIWYFVLGKKLYEHGFRNFDSMTIETFLKDKPNAKKQYETYGGYQTIKELTDLVDIDNESGYWDDISKMNSLTMLCKKYDEIFEDVGRFSNATNKDVFNTFDLLNTSVAINTGSASTVEDLVIDEEFLKSCNEGQEVGISYAKGAPLLNYSTLGTPIGDVYMLAAHSGVGKTSFIFENMVLSFSREGIGSAIISNEMRIEAYKHLLLIHILTHDLKYFKLTRKKLKLGNFSEEEWDMLHQAVKISKEKYKNIKFVKLFDNNTGEVIKFIKRLKSQGIQAIVWDTMKSDDSMDDKMWQQLLMNSRRIFNVISKEKLSLIVTFQLALYTTNQRWLDAGCLSNSKQVKEVVSELILMRRLWQDEYTGEKFDCKPYKFEKDSKIKKFIELDKDKAYVVAFTNKTRNDDDNKTILFQWDGHWNRWKELGFCTIVNDHRSYN